MTKNFVRRAASYWPATDRESWRGHAGWGSARAISVSCCGEAAIGACCSANCAASAPRTYRPCVPRLPPCRRRRGARTWRSRGSWRWECEASGGAVSRSRYETRGRTGPDTKPGNAPRRLHIQVSCPREYSELPACVRRGPLRDELLVALGYAANLELPDWPPLVRRVEAAISELRAALELVEGDETRGRAPRLRRRP